MTRSNSPHGLVERERDGQLLRTKIVATIGKLGAKPSYPARIYDNNKEVAIEDFSYAKLVERFYGCGVDIIRMNLSHFNEDEIKRNFPEIRSAILKCEDQSREYHKRIAVLADLPGPKIRFAFPKDTEVGFGQGEPLTIHFENVIKPQDVVRTRSATVYIDGYPLKKALDRSDERAKAERVTVDDNSLSNELMQNAFGISRVPKGGSFEAMMRFVQTTMNGGETVLVFVGDGDVVLKVTAVNKVDKCCRCDVVVAKRPSVKGEKGFTLKGVDFNVPTFTETDRVRLDALLEADYRGFGRVSWEPVVGFVGLSFAQTAHDIMQIKEYIEQRLRDKGMDNETVQLKAPSIIAKIETKAGWENSEYILDAADGIMVARGDLGLQMKIEEVPHIQKQLIQLCNKRGKPVITATEMLKSMTESIEPTRAESADVFNAIADGTDAIMMSEETASGKHPFDAIAAAINIAAEAELHFELYGMTPDDRTRLNLERYHDFLDDDSARINANTRRFEDFRRAFENRISNREKDPKLYDHLMWRRELYHGKYWKSREQQTTNCITQATCTMSESNHVKAIVAATTTGRTVRMISRLRPSKLIVGAAHDKINTRKLALSYGVIPIDIGKVEQVQGTDGIFKKSKEALLRSEFLSELLDKKVVVFTAGTDVGKPGTTNLIQMREILAAEPAPAPKSEKRKAVGQVH